MPPNWPVIISDQSLIHCPYLTIKPTLTSFHLLSLCYISLHSVSVCTVNLQYCTSYQIHLNTSVTFFQSYLLCMLYHSLWTFELNPLFPLVTYCISFSREAPTKYRISTFIVPHLCVILSSPFNLHDTILCHQSSVTKIQFESILN